MDLLLRSRRRLKRLAMTRDDLRAYQLLRQAAWPGFVFLAVVFFMSESFRPLLNPFQLLGGGVIAAMGIYLVIAFYPFEKNWLAKLAMLIGMGLTLLGGHKILLAIVQAGELRPGLMRQCERLQGRMLASGDPETIADASAAAAAYQALRCWPQASPALLPKSQAAN